MDERGRQACVGVLGFVVAMAGCGGSAAGPFEGIYVGDSNVTTMYMASIRDSAVTSTGTRTQMGTIAVDVAPGTSAGTDLVVRLPDNACALSFARDGNSATLVAGAPCVTQSGAEMDVFTATVMGMAAMPQRTNSSSTTITARTGTLALDGDQLTMELALEVAAMGSEYDRDAMRNVTSQSTANVSVRFVGTRR